MAKLFNTLAMEKVPRLAIKVRADHNMKPSMKTPALCVAGMLFVLCSLSAFANSVKDPRIVVKDPPLCDDGCIGVGQIFNFGLPAGTGNFNGTLSFQNNSDVTWFNLIITEKGEAFTSVSCGFSAFFNFCQVVPVKNNPDAAKIEFFNLYNNGKGGIAPGQVFNFGFTGWSRATDFAGHGYDGAPPTVPEPATMALMLTGAGAIVSRRKFWKKA
ncbi:MAG TPA: PEP-CTERM sorting domain-containing protein [Candidatus Sulfotelmatobacter sp.]|nr:PEP-CTERM sorting domain-containing protein [Candidatus Sulfotelmatobacter sp.]